MDLDLAPYRSFMNELAQKSGDFIRPFFADPEIVVETKADDSPVTLADSGAEELMRRMIRNRFPDHGIIGEELGSDNEGAEFVWTLDPIDGTRAFAAGCPLFGTIISLLHQGVPALGMIHQPVLKLLLIGDNKSATLNNHAVRIRPCARVEDALFLTSDHSNTHKYHDGGAYDALIKRVKMVRTWGDCYGYLILAGGWADVMCDPIMNPWDIQPLIPIIRGAGGIITDWYGGDPVKGKSIVAAGKDLHPQIIEALKAK